MASSSSPEHEDDQAEAIVRFIGEIDDDQHGLFLGDGALIGKAYAYGGILGQAGAFIYAIHSTYDERHFLETVISDPGPLTHMPRSSFTNGQMLAQIADGAPLPMGSDALRDRVSEIAAISRAMTDQPDERQTIVLPTAAMRRIAYVCLAGNWALPSSERGGRIEIGRVAAEVSIAAGEDPRLAREFVQPIAMSSAPMVFSLPIAIMQFIAATFFGDDDLCCAIDLLPADETGTGVALLRVQQRDGRVRSWTITNYARVGSGAMPAASRATLIGMAAENSWATVGREALARALMSSHLAVDVLEVRLSRLGLTLANPAVPGVIVTLPPITLAPVLKKGVDDGSFEAYDRAHDELLWLIAEERAGVSEINLLSRRSLYEALTERLAELSGRPWNGIPAAVGPPLYIDRGDLLRIVLAFDPDESIPISIGPGPRLMFGNTSAAWFIADDPSAKEQSS